MNSLEISELVRKTIADARLDGNGIKLQFTDGTKFYMRAYATVVEPRVEMHCTLSDETTRTLRTALQG